MRLKTKKKIAKEIIIFFSSVVLVSIIVGSFVIANLLKYNQKSKKIESQISKLTNKLDSTSSTFPKLLTLEEMIICNVPVNLHVTYPLSDTLETNIKLLTEILGHYNYPETRTFQSDKGEELIIPLEADIGFAYYFENDLLKNKDLIKIYEFLKSKGCIEISHKQFFLNLKGNTVPPAPSSYFKYEETKKQIKILKNELRKAKNNKYSDKEIFGLAYYIGLIVFILIYPIRFIILILRWATKTLKIK